MGHPIAFRLEINTFVNKRGSSAQYRISAKFLSFSWLYGFVLNALLWESKTKYISLCSFKNKIAQSVNQI